MDSNMERQVVRVARERQEETTPLRLGGSKVTDQDMLNSKAQEAATKRDEVWVARLREIQDNDLMKRARALRLEMNKEHGMGGMGCENKEEEVVSEYVDQLVGFSERVGDMGQAKQKRAYGGAGDRKMKGRYTVIVFHYRAAQI